LHLKYFLFCAVFEMESPGVTIMWAIVVLVCQRIGIKRYGGLLLRIWDIKLVERVRTADDP